MQKVVLSILFNKKEADLSGGLYQRGATVPANCRSQYSTLAPQETASLGMGFVQAVLAILSSHVGKIEYGQQGRVGEVTFYSTSKRPKESYPYHFTWDERDTQNLVYGGFENGVTYQIVVVYLITSYLDAMYRQSVSRAEVIERWDALIYACEGGFERDADTYGWTDFQVKAMCQRPQIRQCIASLCDALWFSMRYQVPTRDEREISITSDSVLLGMGRNVFERDLLGEDLLNSPE